MKEGNFQCKCLVVGAWGYDEKKTGVVVKPKGGNGAKRKL